MIPFGIRPATPVDIPAVMELDRATELLPHWSEAVYAAAVTRLHEGPQRRLFVAHASRELVGFAVGVTAAAGEDVIAELESVAVAESARRIGVATALCTGVIAWAHSLAATQIDLEVRSKNACAIRLYERLGFVAAGRRPRYYKRPDDDALLMRRPIYTSNP